MHTRETETGESHQDCHIQCQFFSQKSGAPTRSESKEYSQIKAKIDHQYCIGVFYSIRLYINRFQSFCFILKIRIISLWPDSSVV